MAMTNTESIHKFEKAGLGKAPFRVIGVERRVGPILIGAANGVESWVGAPGQPMGICDYCGQGIAECWSVESSDGKVFVVGCDCVMKTGDAGLKKVVNKHRSKAAKKREAERIREFERRLESEEFRAALAALPDETGRNRTLLESVQWMIRHAGHAGKIKTVRRVAKLFRP